MGCVSTKKNTNIGESSIGQTKANANDNKSNSDSRKKEYKISEIVVQP